MKPALVPESVDMSSKYLRATYFEWFLSTRKHREWFMDYLYIRLSECISGSYLWIYLKIIDEYVENSKINDMYLSSGLIYLKIIERRKSMNAERNFTVWWQSVIIKWNQIFSIFAWESMATANGGSSYGRMRMFYTRGAKNRIIKVRYTVDLFWWNYSL